MFKHPVLSLGQREKNTALINSRKARSKSQRNMQENKLLKTMVFMKEVLVFIICLMN